MIYRTIKKQEIDLALFDSEDFTQFRAFWLDYLLSDVVPTSFQIKWHQELTDYCLQFRPDYQQHPLFGIYLDLVSNAFGRFQGHPLSDMLVGFTASPFFDEPFAHLEQLKKSSKHCPLDRTQLVFDCFEELPTAHCYACGALYLNPTKEEKMRKVAAAHAEVLSSGRLFLSPPAKHERILELARKRGLL